MRIILMLVILFSGALAHAHVDVGGDAPNPPPETQSSSTLFSTNISFKGSSRIDASKLIYAAETCLSDGDFNKPVTSTVVKIVEDGVDPVVITRVTDANGCVQWAAIASSDGDCYVKQSIEVEPTGYEKSTLTFYINPTKAGSSLVAFDAREVGAQAGNMSGLKLCK